MQFHGVSQRCSSTVRHNGAVPRRITTVLYYDVIPHTHLRQHFSPISSPESAARHVQATPQRFFVAQECGTTRSGDTSALLRRPRVRHDTFRRHFRPFLLPVGVGQNDVRMKGLFGNETHTFRRPRVQYDTFRQHFSPFSLPKGARQNDVRMNGTLRQRNPHFSSPKGKVRHA